MGITALAAFSAEISGGNTMSCNILYGSERSTIAIDKDNALVLQSVEVISDFHNSNLFVKFPFLIGLISISFPAPQSP